MPASHAPSAPPPLRTSALQTSYSARAKVNNATVFATKLNLAPIESDAKKLYKRKMLKFLALDQDIVFHWDDRKDVVQQVASRDPLI